MDNALCASLHVVDDVKCNMLCVCENASMSVYPHDCDAMLHDSLGVSKIVRRKCTFSPYILTFFHFSLYILFLPLLVPKPINAGYLSP